jgi:hypothetical protein
MPVKHVSKKIRLLPVALDNPAMPALIKSLPARELAQLCRRVGINDATHIMALAPANRLIQALEASVWKTPRPGVSEIFDPRELIEWISAWLDIGESFIAERLAAVPDETLALYLSQLATVTTGAMWGFERSTEFEDLDRIYAPSHDEAAYGPYVVRARRQEDWETLRGALDAMWLDAPERLVDLFSQLSGDESMLAPQENRECANDDVASARERSRESQGYVTANGARAFLALAKRPLKELVALSEYDLETRRHLIRLADNLRSGTDSLSRGASENAAGQPEPSPNAGGTASIQYADDRNSAPPAPDLEHLAALHTALEDAGLLDPPPGRLLLTHEPTSKQLPIAKLLQALSEQDATEFEARGRELAYLVSTLIAGIAVDGSVLTPTEARSAALATCNLGLETMNSLGVEARIDCEPGLVRMFLMGICILSTLPERVEAAFLQCFETLRNANSGPVHEWLVEQAQVLVTDLSDAVGKRDFEAAREAAMALGFVFEPRACRAVAPLLDELPRLGTVNGEAAAWIDSLAAIASATELLRSIAAKQRRRS